MPLHRVPPAADAERLAHLAERVDLPVGPGLPRPLSARVPVPLPTRVPQAVLVGAQGDDRRVPAAPWRRHRQAADGERLAGPTLSHARL